MAQAGGEWEENPEERGRRQNPADEDHTREPSPDRGGQRDDRGRKPRDGQAEHRREFSPKQMTPNYDQTSAHKRSNNSSQEGYRSEGGYKPERQRGRGGNREKEYYPHKQNEQYGWNNWQDNPGGNHWGRQGQWTRNQGGQGFNQWDSYQEHQQNTHRNRGNFHTNESRQQGYGGRRQDEDPVVFLSKKLSFILRHGAEKMGFQLMPGGYLWVDDILRRNEYRHFTVEDVRHVVTTNDKQRFHLEEDQGHLKIRANQGHSLEVDGLEMTPITDAKEAPEVIHGTYSSSWDIIKEQGLNKMKRNHIHFAAGEPGENGVISGMRTSCEIIIMIDVEKALNSGLKFFRSANNVILSPGDEHGFIRPCFFKAAYTRYPRQSLLFNDKAVDGPKIPGLSGEMEKKKKKKSKKKSKDNQDDEITAKKEKNEDVDMEGPTSLFSEEDPVDETQKAMALQDDDVPEDWDKGAAIKSSDGATSQTTSKPQEFTEVNDADCSRNAVEDLKPGSVVVYCHMKGEKITSVSCISSSRAYNFSKNLLEGGDLREYLNSKGSGNKIFHNIADASKALFDQHRIILDGTNVYDNKVAFTYVQEKGFGNLNELPHGFDPENWGNLEVGTQLLERCLLSLQAFFILSRWTDKDFKKTLFEEVNKNVDKNEVKEEKDKRKKENKEVTKQPSQQQGSQEGKSKKKKKKKN
ncbi:uncharacterized protein LOC125649502 isoform X2 [Ostrea edulis]|uniref:uncharacterized protein LOC125649502 isoform X2 n=1 Tax=Ostrea edulis TaxID=37623 RepID=UPI0024AF4F2E|nr:uncharacterized protein LOC125649502 isoform X2 [Ostrea edulis]